MTAAIFLPPGGVAGLPVRPDIILARCCGSPGNCDRSICRVGEASPGAYWDLDQPVVFVLGDADVVEYPTV